MPDQLTSVRLSEEALAELRIFAEANETSLAAEIRKAVDEYRKTLSGSPVLREKLQEQLEKRERILRTYMASVDQ
jgi:hypothetical protein